MEIQDPRDPEGNHQASLKLVPRRTRIGSKRAFTNLGGLASRLNKQTGILKFCDTFGACGKTVGSEGSRPPPWIRLCWSF